MGRDVFARVVHATRAALGLGLVGGFGIAILGAALGSLAAFYGGVIDAIVTRLIEALTGIPVLLLVLVVEAILPRATVTSLVLTFILARWTEVGLLVRAEVLRVLGLDYVTAARALGSSPVRILIRHVLPNALGPAVVAVAYGFASLLLMQSAVDFLGAGPHDVLPSWGESLGEARTHREAWWLVVFPGAALLATLAGLNLLGEAARSAIDLFISPQP